MDQSLWEPGAAGSGRPGRRPVRAAVARDLGGLPPVLARAGALELRLAASEEEVRAAQRLRYEVFYDQGHATPDAAASASGRDLCPFDPACDHLLVLDTSEPGMPGEGEGRVVGTYRLLRGDVADRHGGFYSATAFDIGPLLRRHRDRRFLELGRSCVHAAYRSKRVIDLLWQGIGAYAGHHGVDVLIGCSSLAGTEPESLAAPLSFAFHYAAAEAEWQVDPVRDRAARMDWMAREAVDARRGLALLPPLMKAYLRAGATFASRAAVDHDFGTTDLFTVLPLASAEPRYVAHFAPASARAA